MLGFEWRRDRCRRPLRPHRHSCPVHRRLRQDPRCPQGPGQRLLRCVATRSPTVPRSSVLGTTLCQPRQYAGHTGALAGMRIGVIRESMVYPKGSKTEQPIVTAATREIKEMLGDKLGATLVESTHPLWKRDPDIEVMKLDYTTRPAPADPAVHAGPPVSPPPGRKTALRRVCRMRSCRRSSCLAKSSAREPCSRSITSLRWPKATSKGLFNLDIAHDSAAGAVERHSDIIISQYLMRRADDWKAAGFRGNAERLGSRSMRDRSSGATISARPSRTGKRLRTRVTRLDGRQGVNERVMLRELLRRADMMVILENKLDALVRLHTPWAPGLIGHPHQYDIPSNLTTRIADGAECRINRGADPGWLC